MSHEHLSPEELTELAARGGAAREALDAARACPVCGPELAALERFLDRSRAALARTTEAAAARNRDLVAGVLARTTRADTSVRGDLFLFRDYVGARLRASVLLRVAAASLVAHLVALPVLAWYVLDRPEPEQVWITIEPPAEDEGWAEPEDELLPPPALPLDEPAMSSSALSSLLVPLDSAPLRVENSVRLARFELSRGAPSMPAEVAGSEVERLLRARAELVAAFAEGAELPAVEPGPSVGSGLARALAAELRLDAFVLAGRRDGLADALEALLDETGADTGAVRRLEAGALARAEAYGLLTPRLGERLDAERAAAAGRSDALALELLGTEPSGRRTPVLGGAWLEALDAALPPEVRDGPVARAWLDRER